MQNDVILFVHGTIVLLGGLTSILKEWGWCYEESK